MRLPYATSKSGIPYTHSGHQNAHMSAIPLEINENSPCGHSDVLNGSTPVIFCLQIYRDASKHVSAIPRTLFHILNHLEHF